MNTLECKKVLTIVSATLLIGLIIKFYFYFIPCFLTNFLTTKSLLSLGNTKFLCEEHVRL